MLLQPAATHSSDPALVHGRCTGLRQWAACFFQSFLAVTAYWESVFSSSFVSTASRYYSALFQPADLTGKSSGFSCGHPLTFAH